jgi:hypothetical protein
LEPAPPPPALKLSRDEFKAKETAIRRLERQEAEAIAAIEALEHERQVEEAELSRPEVYSKAEAAREAKAKLDSTEANLAAANTHWEKIAADLEKARQNFS